MDLSCHCGPDGWLKSYSEIWTAGGDSPLRQHSRAQADALQSFLNRGPGDTIRVALGMSYGKPSIPEALASLSDHGVRRLIVLPMYPQYSGSTTAAVYDAVSDVFRRQRCIPELRFINHYHDYAPYISVLADSVRRHQEENGIPDKLLFSFHSIPKSYHLAGDLYHCECHKTARLLAAELGLSDEQWAISFQSRFGPAAWLTPATDQTLTRWAQDGIRRVQVLCPGFPADCLETLEEVAMQYRELFISQGGDDLSYIPALNATPSHIAMLAGLIKHHAAGWPEYSDTPDADAAKAREASRQRALAMGARQ